MAFLHDRLFPFSAFLHDRLFPFSAFLDDCLFPFSALFSFHKNSDFLYEIRYLETCNKQPISFKHNHFRRKLIVCKMNRYYQWISSTDIACIQFETNNRFRKLTAIIVQFRYINKNLLVFVYIAVTSIEILNAAIIIFLLSLSPEKQWKNPWRYRLLVQMFF